MWHTILAAKKELQDALQIIPTNKKVTLSFICEFLLFKQDKKVRYGIFSGSLIIVQ
jgi:hypothetical protein